MTRHVVLHGAAVGLSTLSGLRFLPHRPYAGCRICGDVFQSEADRFPNDVFEANPRSFDFLPANVDLYALGMRKEWSQKHARTHSDAEHEDLAISGHWATPIAAQRLVAYGVVPVSDAVFSTEHEEALRQSSPVPTKDADDHV